MSRLTTVLIDSNEPQWVQELKFKHTAPIITKLHVGDAWLTTDDAITLIVERKSASDLIKSVLDDGLRNQCVRIANEQTSSRAEDKKRAAMADFLPILWSQSGHDFARYSSLIAQNPIVAQYFTAISPEAQDAMGQVAVWKYLIYTRPSIRGEFVVLSGAISKIRWRHILGVLVDCQEMGVTCVPIGSDSEYGGTLEWLATRDHGDVKGRAHRRKGIMETDEEFFLSALPNIQERASSLVDNFQSVAWALDWLSNLNSDFKVRGIADGTKNKVRNLLGLADDERLGVINQKWEFMAGANREIVIGENEEGHIWADDGGMVAIVKLLSEAMPEDPRLKELLKGEPQNE